jgi:hypothetical protein
MPAAGAMSECAHPGGEHITQKRLLHDLDMSRPRVAAELGGGMRGDKQSGRGDALTAQARNDLQTRHARQTLIDDKARGARCLGCGQRRRWIAEGCHLIAIGFEGEGERAQHCGIVLNKDEQRSRRAGLRRFRHLASKVKSNLGPKPAERT